MIINHNISAINAHRNYTLNARELQTDLERLSSGLRINRASDDASGLAVSEKMRAQIRGMNQAIRNTQDGISFLQTSEGWLGETNNILQRMRELAVQSSNGIYTNEDRQQIQTEINQLVDEIDRISSQAEFNGLKMLRGGFDRPDAAKSQPATDAGKNEPTSAQRKIPQVEPGQGTAHTLVQQDGGVYIHMGPNMDQRSKIYIGNMSAAALGLSDGDGDSRKLKVDYTTADTSNQAINKIDAALYVVNRQRADIGGYQNRLESATRGMEVAHENMISAESHIRDTDMALGMVRYVKSRILTESSASLLVQANMKPFVVAKLLEGIR